MHGIIPYSDETTEHVDIDKRTASTACNARMASAFRTDTVSESANYTIP